MIQICHLGSFSQKIIELIETYVKEQKLISKLYSTPGIMKSIEINNRLYK